MAFDPNDILVGDGEEYELLAESAKRTIDITGFTCEIGIRAGGGTKCIMDSIIETNMRKIHIGIDPYGDMLGKYGDNQNPASIGYTNLMRNRFLMEIYSFCNEVQYDFLFFNMTDSDFFTSFQSGVPIYKGTQSGICNLYSLVYLDALHTTEKAIEQVMFFKDRQSEGAEIVFDNYDYFDVEYVGEFMGRFGYNRKEKGIHKICFQRNSD